MGQVANSFWTRKGVSSSGPIARPSVFSGSLVKVALLAVGLGLISGCLSFYRTTRLELAAAVAKKQAEQARLDRLKIETETMEVEIKRLRTDRRLIEALARQTLGFVRPGDVVARIDPDQRGWGDHTLLTNLEGSAEGIGSAEYGFGMRDAASRQSPANRQSAATSRSPASGLTRPSARGYTDPSSY